MIPLFIGQAALAIAALALAADRVRDLLYRAPLDTAPFLTALTSALETHDRALARRLADAARPAFIAEVARAALRDPNLADHPADPHPPDANADTLDETLADLRYRATHRLYALRVLARLGTASGLLGLAIQVIWVFSGDHGLLRLEAGLVESLAVQASATAITAGLAISVFCFATLGVLRPAVRALLADMSRTERLFRAPSRS